MIMTSVGPYKILQRLGEGGMGVVYKGIHTALEQPVAMKALSPALSTDPGMKERFLREARIQAQLTHPNIVNLLNFIEEGGVFYLVMEFIEGETLETRIGRGRISPNQAIALTLQVLDALAFAHSKGVIHRDVKPSNIMVTASGRVKVTDFGIAKIVGEKRQTATGIRPGTLWYMSPEQVTGQVPFDADSEYAIMRAHVELAPPPPRSICPDIPKALERIILKALAKRPSERFQGAEEMAKALREVERAPVPVELGETQRKGTVLLPPQPQELRRGNPRLLAIFGGVGMILAALIAMIVWGRGGTPTPPPPKEAEDCLAAIEALKEARQQRPDAAEPYQMAFELFLRGGPCRRAMDPVAFLFLGEAIRRGVDLSSLPLLIEVETRYGTTIHVRPRDIEDVESGWVKLKDGSRYQGLIRIREG